MVPILTAILTPTGLQSTPYEATSLAEAVTHEPGGVYTVTRTFQHDHALLFDAHLDRLEQSAQLAGIAFDLDRDRLRAALRDLIQQADFPDARFRITVPAAQSDHIYLALEPLHPVPAEIMQNGAHLKIVPLARTNPAAKTTIWMDQRAATVNSLPSNVYEGLLVDETGHILEGMSSNFYGVLNGKLYTARDHVLEGIVRRAMLEIAPEVLPVELRALHRDDLPRLTEAIMTSSSRGVVPVTRIDDQPIGDGAIGSVTRALQQAYERWWMAHIAPI
ncbi:MAG: aminotransferase class IV family protein [Anaerolineae bacterium]|nr:aminotransferase class IV family protein [Anaerolineae bacterium]